MNYNYLQKVIFTMLLTVMGMSAKAADIMVSSASEISNASPAPGDRLVMSKSANWANQQITFDFNGTASNPITLIAEGEGEVILSGSANLKIGGQYLIVSGLTFQGCVGPDDLVKFRTGSDADHCRLTNTLFIDNNPSDISTGYKWVSLYGEHNRVDHCWFEGKRHRGTTLVVWLPETPKANYHLIDHNYFTRPVYTSGNNEAETIRIGDSKTSLTDSYTTVEYNFFEECDGEIEVISNKSNHNIYRYNTFFNNAAILTLRHGHHCTVDGNFFFGNNASGSGGVRIIGVGHTVTNNYMQDLAGSGNLRAPIVLMGGVNGYDEFDATNRYVAAQENTVAFNTIINCKQNIYIGSDKSSSSETYDPPFNNTIDNNIIYNGDDPALEFEYGEISSFSYSGNIYYGTSLGKSSGAGFTNVDPQLSTPSGFNPAHIGSSSPAINAATGNYSILEDFDGQPRTGTKDVGCDEYSTSAVVRKPILKTEVGPCWMSTATCGVVTPTVDCNGDENGSASIDNCQVCSGGNTGITPNSTCQQDCNGEWNGSASVDQCGVCSGGSTGITVDACLECNAAQASSDDGNVAANTLDDDLSTRWSALGVGEYIEFCLGTETTLNSVSIAFYNGNVRTTTFDVQVTTDGINWTTILSNQVSSGNTLEKEEFTFADVQVLKLKIIGKGNSSNDWNSITEVSWGQATVVTDCNGDANGSATIDNCGVCSGGNTGVTPNSTCLDCNGDVNGTASVDACGICSGGNTGVTASSPTNWYQDTDNDGLGDPAVSVEDCNQPTGYVANSNDDCPNDASNTCNDPVDCNGDVNGTASIDACGICSGGNTGVIASSPTTWYQDSDNDGLGDPAVSVSDCNQPTGYVANSNDECPNDASNTCNDPVDCNGDVNGTASIDDCGVCSGGNTGVVINDCNVGCVPAQASSDDGNVAANTLDNDFSTRWSANGSGQYIEYCLGSETTINTVSIAFYKGDTRTTTFDILVSADGTNWSAVLSNQVSSGITLQKEDYTIAESTINYIRIVGYGNSSNTWNSLTEVSWSLEQIVTDCNGDVNGTASIDACGICSGGNTGVVASAPTTWYQDSDNDGLGDPAVSVEDCNQPTGYVANSNDDCPNDASNTCNDPVDCNGDVNGTASVDACGICSGGNTGVVVSGPTTWYQDADNDGLGDPAVSVTDCNQPTGYVANSNDECPNDASNTCNDPVDCNGDVNGTASIDDCGVCSGGNTGITPSSPTTWYEDADNDGFGDPNTSVEVCGQPVGYVATVGDQCPNDGNKTEPGECGCGEEEGTCSSNECDAPNYNASTAYDQAGTQVVYDLKLYQNKWYTQGNAPGDANGPWELIGFCGADPLDCSGSVVWDASTAYSTTGTQVVHNGVQYRNKWYASGIEPGTHEVWEYLGPCSDSSMNNLKVMGVSSNAHLMVSLYPNPITQGATVYIISEEVGINSVSVIDVFGNVKSQLSGGNDHHIQVNTDDLVAGTYVIIASLSNGSQSTLRLIVE